MTRRTVFLRVLGLHLLAILFLGAGSFLRGCKHKPKEIVISVDLSALPEEVEPLPTLAPEPTQRGEAVPTLRPTPAPTATPTPTPQATSPLATATPAPTATPRPTATPKPTATPAPARPTPTPTPTMRYATVDDIRARITPRPTSVPLRPIRTPSPAEIMRLMAAGGLSGGESVTTATGGTVDFGGVAQAVYQRMYAAWRQPPNVSASAGYKVRASIIVQRDGHVLRSRILKSSGHPAMDLSVQDALNAVRFIAPLPAGYGEPSREFIVEFVITE